MDLTSYMLGKKAGGGGTPAILIDKNISANGTYNASSDEADGYKKVVVDVEPNLTTKSITQNGTYNASSDNADGYSSVTVETSGVDINEYFNTTITQNTSQSNRLSNMIPKKYPPVTITNNVTSLEAALYGLTYVDSVDFSRWDISNVRSFNKFAQYCYVPTIDMSSLDFTTYSWQLDLESMFNSTYSKYIYMPKVDMQNNVFSNCKRQFFYNSKNITILDLSQVTNLSAFDNDYDKNSFVYVGQNCLQSEGAYADGIPYVYVKDAIEQNALLNATTLVIPDSWSANNVVIKQS